MAIPLSYNLRNLRVRMTTTIMTALGIGLTVAVLLAILALVGGLQTAFEASGHPLNVLVMRKGSDSELVSSIARSAYQEMRLKPGIAKSKSGEPLTSPEVIAIVNLPSVDNPDGSNITLRGVTPPAYEVRGNITVPNGRWFEAGKREVTVGKGIAARFPGTSVGATIKFGRGDWTVVGVFDAGRSAHNSEIWADLYQIGADWNRLDNYSSILIRATDEVAAAALTNDLPNDQRFVAGAMPEKSYYAKQTSSGDMVKYLGLFVSGIMAVGSGFAATNTMYASVARRAREIGTLRVLGFSKGAILMSFLIESVLLAALGGVIGCLLVLPLNGMTTGISNFATFSEIAFDFRVGPDTMATGVAFAIVLGAIGGLFPAFNAARKEILVALRQL